MDDFLSKPIGPAELFAAIDRVLAGRPASEAPRASSPGPGILLDPTTLLAACDDDPVLLGKLIGIFRNNLPGSLARVQEAIARRDPAQLRESAHQLRGLLSTFSPEAAQAAARLEAMGAGGELGDAASTFETLAELIERLGPSWKTSRSTSCAAARDAPRSKAVLAGLTVALEERSRRTEMSSGSASPESNGTVQPVGRGAAGPRAVRQTRPVHHAGAVILPVRMGGPSGRRAIPPGHSLSFLQT